jgi:hypothetical protein
VSGVVDRCLVFDEWPATWQALDRFEARDGRGRKRSQFRCFWTKPKPAYMEAVKLPDLKALKAAMADAHPDRGGSSEAFIRAREAYEAAKAAHAHNDQQDGRHT